MELNREKLERWLASLRSFGRTMLASVLILMTTLTRKFLVNVTGATKLFRGKLERWWATLGLLGRAMMVSLLIHMTTFTGIFLVNVTGATKLLPKLKPPDEFQSFPNLRKRREPPMIFLEVPPEMEATEAPEKAKYYASRNARASNRNPDQQTGIPKIEGTQTVVPKVVEVVKPAPKPPPPPEPVPPQPKPVEHLPLNPRPKEPLPVALSPKPKPVELAKPKQQPIVRAEQKPKPKPKPKPKSTTDARRQKALAMARIQGHKKKQEGGVKSRTTFDGLDAKATPFGNYDAQIIAAISSHWHELIDQLYLTQSGKVVVTFRLHEDGRVSNVDSVESTVNFVAALKCRRAVSEPAPFPRWPPDMRKAIGGPTRFVKITFHYH